MNEINEEMISADEIEEEPIPNESDTPSEDPLRLEIVSLRSELSELREELKLRAKAEEVNRRNASLSAGRAGMNAAPEYYSPEEVRAMSAHEVRENYQKIRASMKRWH